ncbi:MAG: CaiB/BaiF CoA-transferase family protein [Hyphomicrobiales bacterium]
MSAQNNDGASVQGALDGLVVLDLTRILAGPTCTQVLGDLGATVWKIENPRTSGDDTRAWGPPYAVDRDGQPTDLSAYFIATNRNKQSVGVDIASREGQALLAELAARADVVVENFKPGDLARYGLDHETLCARHPGLVYCSISGFGHTGPNREKPGYDLMAQGYGGMMSLTGEPDGEPMKVGVGVADVMCGMYAAIGILAALRYRERTGEGQHIDLSLVDSQMAWLINEGCSTLMTGQIPVRRGNGHPNIMPYQTFEAHDGHVIIAVGNDAQFARFTDYLDVQDLVADPRFASNADRVVNREALLEIIKPLLAAHSVEAIVAGLEMRKIPVGAILNVDQALASDQAQAREMVVRQSHPALGDAEIAMLGNPLKFSKTPVQYRTPPPTFGQDSEAVIASLQDLPKKDS